MNTVAKGIRLMPLVGWFVLFLAVEVFGNPRVSLDQTLYFLGPGGGPVELTTGIYEVEVGPEDAQNTVRFSGDHGQKTVLASPIEHEGEVGSTVALVVPDEKGNQSIIILMPDGKGLEAFGLITMVQSRGMTDGTSTSSGVRQALATVRPGMNPASNQGRFNSSGASLPASKTPSMELQQINQQGKPSGRPRRPSSGQLLDILRGFPGGKESIERAKVSGARISFRDHDQDEPLLSWLNPFTVPSAFAQGEFSVTLSPRQPMVGPHYLSFSSVGVRNDASIGFYGTPNFKFTSKGYIWVQVPITGWYIINIEAESMYKNTVELKHYDPDSSFFSMNRSHRYKHGSILRHRNRWSVLIRP
jgi:hypothetical protein